MCVCVAGGVEDDNSVSNNSVEVKNVIKKIIGVESTSKSMLIKKNQKKVLKPNQKLELV